MGGDTEAKFATELSQEAINGELKVPDSSSDEVSSLYRSFGWIAVRLSNSEAGAACTRGPPPGLGRAFVRWRRGRLLRGVRSCRSGGSQQG